LAKATLFHEHLQLGFGYYTSPPTPMRPNAKPTPDDTARFIELVTEELRMIEADGVGCVVDAAIGRRSDQELDNLRELATRSKVHVVVAGGYFKDPYPKTLAAMSESQIVDHLVADAAAQRWGAFGEIGTSMKMHPDERKFLQALSQAHLRTGIPIFTHTEHHGCRSCALEQLDLFEAQGVKPASLCIGHLSDITTDQDATSETHKAIARRGAFLGFDTVGRALGGAAPNTPGKLPPDFPDVPDRDKVRRVMTVLEAGFEDQVLLSCDFSSSFDLKANWGSGFSAAIVQFVPKLRHAGVGEATLQKILVDNPRRFLAFVPGAATGKTQS
jgi:phosphotriesterase-related protein